MGLISEFVKQIFSEKIIKILLHKVFGKPKSATFLIYRTSSPQKAPLSRKITRSGHTEILGTREKGTNERVREENRGRPAAVFSAIYPDGVSYFIRATTYDLENL